MNIKYLRVFVGLCCLTPLSAYGQGISINNVGNTQKAAVYVEAYNSGTHIGNGTAFKVKYSTSPEGGEFVFLVTAKHVIQNADSVRVFQNRNLNAVDRNSRKEKIVSMVFPLSIEGNMLWEAARDNVDIGVVFLGYESKGYVNSKISLADQYMQKRSTDTDEIWVDNLVISIPEETMDMLPESDLSDVFYVGYPLGLRSDEWLRAFARRCTIALPTMEGIHMQGVNENDFLTDCAPFEGDSGSPVFIHEVTLEPMGGVSIHTKLIGVMLGYISWDEITKTSSKTRDMQIDTEIHKKNMLGMGKVGSVRYVKYAIQDYLTRSSR